MAGLGINTSNKSLNGANTAGPCFRICSMEAKSIERGGRYP